MNTDQTTLDIKKNKVKIEVLLRNYLGDIRIHTYNMEDNIKRSGYVNIAETKANIDLLLDIMMDYNSEYELLKEMEKNNYWQLINTLTFELNKLHFENKTDTKEFLDKRKELDKTIRVNKKLTIRGIKWKL